MNRFRKIATPAWTIPLLCLLGHAAVCAGEGDSEPVRVEVGKGSSHTGSRFEYSLQHLRDERGHRVFAVTYPSPVHTELPANNVIPAEYYVPSEWETGDAPRPAVICLHILNGDFELVRLLCTVLAERGIPALFFKLPYYGERAGPAGRGALLRDVELFSEALTQSLADIRRTVDVLTSRPEVDGDRIGISGISLGAILAASACGVEPRLHRAQLILGGGDLMAILQHARETRALRQSLEQMTAAQRDAVRGAIGRIDPLVHGEALARLAGKGRLAMINATDDEVIPKGCTLRLAEASGMSGEIQWLQGLGHYTAMAALPQIVRNTADFFAQDLPPEVNTRRIIAKEDSTPSQAFADVLEMVASLIAVPPAEARCHSVSVNVGLSLGGGRDRTYDLSFIRGSGGRFRLQAEPVPEVGALCIGTGQAPWMTGRDGVTFVGTDETGNSGKDFSEYIDPTIRTKIQIAGGALMAVALAPEAFSQILQVQDADAPADERRLDFTIRHKGRALTGQLHLRRPDLTPVKMTARIDDTRIDVDIRQLAVNGPAPEGLFGAPVGARITQVKRQDLLRMFAATLQFAMEKMQ